MNIDSNIPPPSTDAPKTRKPRARQPKIDKINPAASLIEALKFIKPIQSKAGTVQQTHCIVGWNWLVVSNEIITIAAPIKEDLIACPNTIDFLEALQNCEDELTITQLSPQQLAIKSGNFKALIECCKFEEIKISSPDANIAPINNEVAKAIEAVMSLAIEGAPNAAYSAVLLQAGSAVATNGAALMEAWHGVDLPPALMLPKPAAQLVARSGKDLTGFGYSESSVTFWFADGSWLKTQLYKERFPQYQQILDRARNLWPVKKEFMKAVKAIDAFSRNGTIYMDKGLLSSRELENEATSFKIDGLPDGMAFNANYLKLCEHAIKNIAFVKETHECFFSADNVRGCIKGIALKEEKEKPENPGNLEDDDIPF